MPTIIIAEPHLSLWYNYGMNKKNLGSKTKLLWQNPEYRQHMIDAHKGKIHSGSFKLGHTIRNTGRTRFKEGIYQGYGFKKGQVPWNWKGDEVGYYALHAWIIRNWGKATKCVNGHIAKRYFWANISGEYKRDTSDWHELCQSCNQTDGIKIHERFKI